jgi:hypothetical protein
VSCAWVFPARSSLLGTAVEISQLYQKPERGQAQKSCIVLKSMNDGLLRQDGDWKVAIWLSGPPTVTDLRIHDRPCQAMSCRLFYRQTIRNSCKTGNFVAAGTGTHRILTCCGCCDVQEDAKLVKLVKTYGPCNWSLISAQLRLEEPPGRVSL